MKKIAKHTIKQKTKNLKLKLQENLKQPRTILSMGFLLTIIFGGLALRLYSLGAQSVWLDEAISGIAAKAIVEQGAPILPSGTLYTRAALHTHLTALSFNIFGTSTMAGRIPSVIFGTLTILVAYLLGKKIKGNRFALLFAFFIAFATVQIAWSQQIRFYQQLQFFFLLSLYMLERFLDKTTWKNLALLAVPMLAMTVSHNSFGYLLNVPIISWFFIEKSGWIIQKTQTLKTPNPKTILTTTAIATLALILTIYFGETILSNFSRAIQTQANYWQNYIAYFNFETSFLLLLAIPGAILAVIERKRNLLYILSFLLPLYMIANHVAAMQHRYVFMLLPLLFMFALQTIEHTIQKTQKTFKPKPKLQILIPIIITLIFLASATQAANFTFYPKQHYNLGPTTPQGEFQPAYTYIQENWQENDVLASTLTPVSWFYLQQSHYWISFSFWGYPELPNTDTYTAAQVIKTSQDMQQTIQNNPQGWVVVDLMGMSRANQEVLEYIDQNLKQIEQVSGRAKGVWVYRWNTHEK